MEEPSCEHCGWFGEYQYDRAGAELSIQLRDAGLRRKYAGE